MKKVIVYIDGFNLYHAIDELKNPPLKWLNLWTLGTSFLEQNEKLIAVNYYTAVLNWEAQKQKRHVNYIKAQRASGVTVHEANFKKSKRACRETGRTCRFNEEKQTDVAIAVSMVADAIAGSFDRAVLITADSDQIPTVKFVRAVRERSLSLYYPPGRGTQARDLGNIVGNRKEITAGRLATCLLPRTVTNSRGRAVAHMPALYAG